MLVPHRAIYDLSLEHTRGNYKLLVSSFNLPPEDYKKFLNFLRKHECQLPFQAYRQVDREALLASSRDRADVMAGVPMIPA